MSNGFLLQGSSDRHIDHLQLSWADVRAQIESSVLQQVKSNMEMEDKGLDIVRLVALFYKLGVAPKDHFCKEKF